MRAFKTAVLFLIIVTLSACSFSKNNGNDADDTAVQNEEEIDMKYREFCRVISEENGRLGLVNAAGEQYSIDVSLAPNIHLNDNVLLIYNSRSLEDNGVYSADVYAVYFDDLTVVTPKR